MNAVSVKDNLLQLLNGDDKFTAVETVLTVLEHTVGFWEELNYAYKAKEIAYRCCRELDGEHQTTKQRKEAVRLRAKAFALEQLYREIEHKRFVSV